MLEILFPSQPCSTGTWGKKNAAMPVVLQDKAVAPDFNLRGVGAAGGFVQRKFPRLHSGHSDFSRGGKRGSLKAAALAMFQVIDPKRLMADAICANATARSWPFSAIVTK